MAMVEVDGYRVAYERVGAGPPLLLLHGYVGDGASTWGPQLDALSDDFTVIAWDAPGAGRSSDPPERFGMAGYADCLARFVDRLGVGQPHVVGLSFGGALAIEFCRLYPAVPSTLDARRRLRRMGGLASARDRGTASPPGARAVRAVARRVRRHVVADDVLRTVRRTRRRCVAGGDAHVPPCRLPGHGVCGGRGPAAGAAVHRRSDAPRSMAPTTSGRRRPLPIICTKPFRGSTLVRLPGVGHVCNIEAPDAFNATIREFLRDPGVARP